MRGYAEAEYVTGYSSEREAELRTLCDPLVRGALAENTFELISYQCFGKSIVNTVSSDTF